MLRIKMRAGVLALLALFIVSGIAASASSAAGPYWHVASSRLGQGQVRQLKLQLKGTAVLSASFSAESKVTVVCNSSVSEGATIEGQGERQGQGKGRITFTSCKVTKPTSGCTVVEPITTAQVKSHLVTYAGTQAKYAELFEPTEGKTYVTLKFVGSGCGVVVGSQPVTGTVAAEVLPVEKESQEGLLNFPAEPLTKVFLEGEEKKPGLFLGGHETVFNAAYGARLATGEQWGVFGS